MTDVLIKLPGALSPFIVLAFSIGMIALLSRLFPEEGAIGAMSTPTESGK